MLLVSVTPLRHAGVRSPGGKTVEGYLRTERAGSTVAAYLISNFGGMSLAGPLFEPRLVRADHDGIVLQGFEKAGDAAVVQEWRIGPMRLDKPFHPPGWLASRS